MVVETVGFRVFEFLAKQFAGKSIDKWLKDRSTSAAFAETIDNARGALVEAGHPPKGPLAIEEQFLTDDVVVTHLWEKLIAPASSDSIDYSVLSQRLAELYGEAPTPETDLRVFTFVDLLFKEMRKSGGLRELRNQRIIAALDHTLSPLEQHQVIQNYVDDTSAKVRDRIKEDAPEYTEYIEPLIEKVEQRKERRSHEPSDREEMGDGRGGERRTPVDLVRYFLDGTDSQMAVVAESGYGKTRFLRELFLRQANRVLGAAPQEKLTIPILLSPTTAATLEHGNICHKIKEWLRGSFSHEGVERLVEQAYDEGRFLFLIDALDQVRDRTKLKSVLEHGLKRNRMVITTRPNMYFQEQSVLRDFDHLELREFDDKRMSEYVGDERLRKLKDVVDDKFLEVPLLLRMVAEHWHPEEEDKAVHNRAQLYRAMFEDLVQREVELGVAEPQDSLADMCKLAYLTMIAKHYGDFPRDFAIETLGRGTFRELESRRWIMKVVEGGATMSFRHRSFQEYLAACYLKKHILSATNLDKIEDHLHHPDWLEVLRFLAGMLPDELAEALILKLINTDPSKPLTKYYEHLRLAIIAHAEFDYREPAITSVLVKTFDNLIAEHGNELEKLLVSKVLSSARSSLTVRMLTSRLTPDHGRNIRSISISALGRIKAEAAVPSLLEILKSEESDGCPHDDAADAIGTINAQTAVAPLLGMLLNKELDNYLRGRAAVALSKMRAESAIAHMLALLEDKNSEVLLRGKIAYALGDMRVDAAVEPLLRIMRDERESEPLRWGAAQVVGELDAEASVEPLLAILTDRAEKRRLRWMASFAVGLLKTKAVVPPLLDILNDKESDSYLRERAAYDIGDLQEPLAADRLLEIFKDKESGNHLRCTALNSISRMNLRAAVPTMVEILNDKSSHHYLQWETIRAIEKMNAEAAVAPLIEVLQDKKSESDLKGRAADALGAMKAEAAVAPLLKILRNDKLDSDLRRRAARALRAIKSESARSLVLRRLAEMLPDDDLYWILVDVLREVDTALRQEERLEAIE